MFSWSFTFALQIKHFVIHRIRPFPKDVKPLDRDSPSGLSLLEIWIAQPSDSNFFKVPKTTRWSIWFRLNFNILKLNFLFVNCQAHLKVCNFIASYNAVEKSLSVDKVIRTSAQPVPVILIEASWIINLQCTLFPAMSFMKRWLSFFQFGLNAVSHNRTMSATTLQCPTTCLISYFV
jgi:hypothetical protein